jgi:putative transposon-encoded protein
LFGKSAIIGISILVVWVCVMEREMKDQIHQMEKERCSNVEQSDCSVKFQVYGEAMLDKEVGCNGSCGRIYLPGDWVGHRVKIILID